MIKRFKSNALKRFSEKGDTRKLPKNQVARIDEILTALQTSDPLRALRMPTYRLHPLKGNRKNEWSVKVTGNRRITFRLDGQDAYDIDLIDYH